MSTAIRFDPATGRLEGTEFPAIPDLIAFARDNNHRFEVGIVWRRRPRCGCWVGLAAIQKGGEAGAFAGVHKDRNPTTEEAMDVLGLRLFDTDSGLVLNDAVGWQVVGSFDYWDGPTPEEYPDWSSDLQQAHLYGRAAGEAVQAAGLWREPDTAWEADLPADS